MADFSKDPQSKLDYQVDWSAWLATSEEIFTSDWTVPSGITEETGIWAASKDADSATIWLSGGTAGAVYKITNTIVTNASPARTAERSFTVLVTQR